VEDGRKRTKAEGYMFEMPEVKIRKKKKRN